VFHVSLLDPYHARDGAFPKSAPIPIDGEDEWQIEFIQAKHTRKGKTEYLVRWTGYSPANDSWESAESLANTEALDEFERYQLHYLAGDGNREEI
jgi:Chromo (CHRromatin Organisation MOdifier) domain